MLGLMRMSECARQVEDACRAGTGPAAALLHCRDAAADIRLYALPIAASSCRKAAGADLASETSTSV
jgi:hypothetical protein